MLRQRRRWENDDNTIQNYCSNIFSACVHSIIWCSGQQIIYVCLCGRVTKNTSSSYAYNRNFCCFFFFARTHKMNGTICYVYPYLFFTFFFFIYSHIHTWMDGYTRMYRYIYIHFSLRLSVRCWFNSHHTMSSAIWTKSQNVVVVIATLGRHFLLPSFYRFWFNQFPIPSRALVSHTKTHTLSIATPLSLFLIRFFLISLPIFSNYIHIRSSFCTRPHSLVTHTLLHWHCIPMGIAQ